MPVERRDDPSTASASLPALRPGRRRLWRYGVVLTVVVGLGVWLIADRAEAPPSRSTGEAVIQQYQGAERRELAEFEGRLLSGGMFDSRDLEGGVSVFNVWGSWCVPCRTEAPALVRLATEQAGQVKFIGINVRDSDDAARAFERQYEVPYPSITTGDSNNALLAFGSAAVAAVPTSIVVDAEGRIAARVVGPTTYTTLRTLVEEVLAESPSQGESPPETPADPSGPSPGGE